MGMKLARINYHWDRAAAARVDDAAGRPVNQGAKRYGTHLERAAMHEEHAMTLIMLGLQEYAGRAQTRGARTQRRRRRRLARLEAGTRPGRGLKAADGWVSPGGQGSGFSRRPDDS
jgi:hypothetical protein